MKKKKNIEMEIYESLGIKTFKKITIKLFDASIFALPIKASKQEKEDLLNTTMNTFHLGKIKNLEDIEEFKVYLSINTILALGGVSVCLSTLLKTVENPVSLSTIIPTLTVLGLNTYGIMLQRYNCIRINQVIEKMVQRPDKPKDGVGEELKKENTFSNTYTYTRKEEEINRTTEDFIETANIEQLKQYRDSISSWTETDNQKDYESTPLLEDTSSDVSGPMVKRSFSKLN